MSNVYILEPPTSGKVLLKTTVGDIDIELWAKETPKACRNFIQLCLEGYYNNTVFHRLVKGFIVQGGDPNGDGTGGESIYGETFKDEFHSRLRFTRRGIVAMANAGKDDNGSQFFFTLAATPELQNVHTIFGKVTGETVFNMIKLEDGLVDHERPVYPHKILKTEVLSNPFPDIEPRIVEKQDKSDKKKKERTPGVKNFKLLSFGAEAEEDEEETSVANQVFVGKGKSTHDLLDDPKLSTKTVIKSDDSEDSEEWEDNHEEELENIRNKLKSDKKKPTSYYLNKDEKEARKRKADEIREEIIKVKKEYQQNKLTKETEKVEETKKTAEKSETFKAYKEEFDKYKDKKESLPKKGKTREDFTLGLLAKFKKKLETIKDKMEEEAEENKEEQPKKDEDSDPEDTTWLAHKLKFAANEAVLARDANTKGDDWYEVYDPRNPLNKRRREESKKNLKHKVGNK